MTSMILCASHAPGLDRDTAGVAGSIFRKGMEEARLAVEKFDPEVVVLFGGDHRRAFRHVAPAFAVALSAELLPEGSVNAQKLEVPSEARGLLEHLLEEGFDVAACRDVALDHAFGQPLHHYLPDPASVRIIPVPVNCAAPPLPSARRTVEFGAAVGAYFAQSEQRVLYIGTGGLSHNPPTLDNERYDLTDAERTAIRESSFESAKLLIKPDWDEDFIDAMEKWDLERLIPMTDGASAQAGVGANEVRTWLAATAAGGRGGVRKVVYEPVPDWITGMGIALSSVG